VCDVCRSVRSGRGRADKILNIRLAGVTTSTHTHTLDDRLEQRQGQRPERRRPATRLIRTCFTEYSPKILCTTYVREWMRINFWAFVFVDHPRRVLGREVVLVVALFLLGLLFFLSFLFFFNFFFIYMFPAYHTHIHLNPTNPHIHPPFFRECASNHHFDGRTAAAHLPGLAGPFGRPNRCYLFCCGFLVVVVVVVVVADPRCLLASAVYRL
jgi:hypothetical protein